MVINEVFPNPTVKKVIFQIRYPNLFYIENKIGDFQLKVMAEFPESALIFRQRMIFADFGPDVKIEKQFQDKPEENASKIWQFKSPKGYALNVMGDSLDITSEFHKTYNNQASDNRFRDIIELVVNCFFEVMAVPTVKRIGLRYIDECPIPEKTNEKFKEFYESTFPLTRFKLEDAIEMVFRTAVNRGENYLRFMETLGRNEEEYKLILDFDAYSEKVEPERVLQITDDLHDLIIKEYEKSIKEPVFEHMRDGG